MALHFQNELRELILKFKPKVVVETGVCEGESTIEILKALDKNDNGGKLFSCEPWKGGYKKPHPRWNLFEGPSYEGLVQIYDESGPWDFFLHDSDHAPGCMAYEFEMALGWVVPGGIIAADDYKWCGGRVWDEFLKRTGNSEGIDIGAAAYIEKRGPLTDLTPEQLHKKAVKWANEMCERCQLKHYLPMRDDYVVDHG